MSTPPPYFRNSFTISSAPAAFLFLSVTTHSSTSTLVNSLCNSFGSLSSRFDFEDEEGGGRTHLLLALAV